MDVSMLKSHLSDDLFAQVEDALKTVDGFTVITTNDGTWVPKSRLNDEIDKRKALNSTISTLNAQLAEAKQNAQDAAGLQAKIDQLTKDVADRDGQITAIRREGKVLDELRAANPHDARVVMRLLDMSKISEDKDGKLTGVEEQVKALKESSGYLFQADPNERGGFGGGRDPHAGSNGGSNQDVNNAIRAAAGRGV